MEITLQRYSSNAESTLGLLLVDCTFQCYSIEDEFRTQKVKGETRIPSGRFQIKLRTEGGFHLRYLNKFGAQFHKGMLELQDVPNFKYILIHIGNDDGDTAGCLLVGNNPNNNQLGKGFVGGSTDAYKKLYPLVLKEILAGNEVWINVKDEGQLDLS